MDCSLPGSCIHGIVQAKVLEWGATAFSGTDSLPSWKSRVQQCHLFKTLYSMFLGLGKPTRASLVTTVSCGSGADTLSPAVHWRLCLSPLQSPHGIFWGLFLQGQVLMNSRGTVKTKSLSLKHYLTYWNITGILSERKTGVGWGGSGVAITLNITVYPCSLLIPLRKDWF